AAFGVDRQVTAFRQGVAPQLAADRRGRPAHPGPEPANPEPPPPHAPEPFSRGAGEPFPLLQAQMRPARHRPSRISVPGQSVTTTPRDVAPHAGLRLGVRLPTVGTVQPGSPLARPLEDA